MIYFLVFQEPDAFSLLAWAHKPSAGLEMKNTCSSPTRLNPSLSKAGLYFSVIIRRSA